MWKVDIYLEADSKAQKNTERKCAYILETICAGAIKTAEGFQCISGTYHSATLQNLVAALSRIRKTSNVCVHTEDVYVVSRIRKLPEMAAANWEDARGTRIGNAELWKRIWELIEEHRLTLTAKAGKGQKCYFQNKKVRKRECAIQPASCMTRAAGPAISVLRFTITGMNTGSLMSIMCSEDQTGRTPRNMV